MTNDQNTNERNENKHDTHSGILISLISGDQILFL